MSSCKSTCHSRSVSGIELGVIAFAVRYAMNRNTGAPLMICNYIKSRWGDMPQSEKIRLQKEVKQEIKTVETFGNCCPSSEWYELIQWMSDKLGGQ